jgi:maleate isomerase
MSTEVQLPKPQDPWIGKRGRIGVVIPSTNIGVEYDCQRFIPEGVSWHTSRFFVELPDLTSDNAFLAFIEAIRETIPGAMRDVMTAEVDHVMMGISAETFWGGQKGNAEFSARLHDVIGHEIGLTTGANAIDMALKQFDAKNVSVVSPYQPIGDVQVLKFFTESGFTVKRNIGLRCDTATSIAHTPQKDVIDVVVNQLDGDDVDAIVQVGTNMSNSDLFPTLEKMLGKPVIPINVATIWSALRAIGVNDRFVEKGRLFEEF